MYHYYLLLTCMYYVRSYNYNYKSEPLPPPPPKFGHSLKHDLLIQSIPMITLCGIQHLLITADFLVPEAQWPIIVIIFIIV